MRWLLPIVLVLFGHLFWALVLTVLFLIVE
jgi:hypothetical protein